MTITVAIFSLLRLLHAHMSLGHPTLLFKSYPFEDHRCRAETGECALDQVDPDKGTQPDKARMNPGGKDKREQQHATRDDSDSVIYCHGLSPYLL
jgi:hypothetical protein